jgi:hypothetical protein
MNELFREVKALKGGDVGIQIDIFGNCYVHRALPVYDDSGHLPGFIKQRNVVGRTRDKLEMVNENNIICMHA